VALLHCSQGVVEGHTTNLSYSGALIEGLTALPVAGEECDIVLDFPVGTVHARCRVVRVDPERGTCGVDLAHLDENGALLLAILMTAGATEEAD
jgi:hypothetical protein